VPTLAELPICLRPIPCRFRFGKSRYAEFMARLLPELGRLAEPSAMVLTRSLGVALAGQLVVRRLALELHQDLSPRARLVAPLLGRHVRWVAISGNLRDHLIRQYGVAPDHVAACHDAVDYDRFAAAVPLGLSERPLPAAYAGPVHLYYGTLRPERGLLLIAAAARALPNHGFVLIGGTTAEAEAARALGLDLPNVLILPAVAHAQIPGLLCSYDSVLLPYTRDVGTHRWMSPLKLFEAMASGTPAVVSRLGPIVEVVSSEHVAFINCERLDGLVEALLDIERNPEAARARAVLGQQLSRERHTWERRARDIIDLTFT
ncbi:MAG: glycosyltransferase family 4 protein, partial [Rhodospirillaceae bacterium]